VGLPIAEDACTWLLASVECTIPVICDVGISTWGLAGAMVWISYKENEGLKSEKTDGRKLRPQIMQVMDIFHKKVHIVMWFLYMNGTRYWI
jgi:hypothetical protein